MVLACPLYFWITVRIMGQLTTKILANPRNTNKVQMKMKVLTLANLGSSQQNKL